MHTKKGAEKPVAFRFREDIKQMLKELAIKDNRSMAEYLSRLIEKDYEKKIKKDPE